MTTTAIPTTSPEDVDAEFIDDVVEESYKDDMVSATSMIRVAKERAISGSDTDKGKVKGTGKGKTLKPPLTSGEKKRNLRDQNWTKKNGW